MATRRKNNIIPIAPARKEAPATPQAEPRAGSRLTITLADDSRIQGTVLAEPMRGTVGILLAGKLFYGCASAHTPTTVRLLIENRISVEPLAAVTLVRLDMPRNSAA